MNSYNKLYPPTFMQCKKPAEHTKPGKKLKMHTHTHPLLPRPCSPQKQGPKNTCFTCHKMSPTGTLWSLKVRRGKRHWHRSSVQPRSPCLAPFRPASTPLRRQVAWSTPGRFRETMNGHAGFVFQVESRKGFGPEKGSKRRTQEGGWG